MADKHQNETQEQSIKARKNELFEEEAPVFLNSSRPFRDFLRETPAEPLSGAAKAMLWVAGVIVAVLLVAALSKSFHSSSKAGPRPVKKVAQVAIAPPLRLLGIIGPIPTR
jgi:hypothetical protein